MVQGKLRIGLAEQTLLVALAQAVLEQRARGRAVPASVVEEGVNMVKKVRACTPAGADAGRACARRLQQQRAQTGWVAGCACALRSRVRDGVKGLCLSHLIEQVTGVVVETSADPCQPHTYSGAGSTCIICSTLCSY